MSAARRHRIPAVVVGAGINGLGVLRSLAREGVPVVVVDSDSEQPAMRSRHGRKYRFCNHGQDALVRALEELAVEWGARRPVLLLTQEHAVVAVAVHRARLALLYRFTLPDTAILNTLLHKDGVRAVAESAGARVPRTLRIQQVEEIDDIVALRTPLVIKPAIRDARYSSVFLKAYRVDDREQARALLHRILPTLPDVVVQEWIEGGDSDIYFCLQYLPADASPPTSFVGRKIRSWPPQVGGTASCTAAPEAAAELIETTTAFFRHAGVTGLASMEYKRDATTGEYVIVEPTIGRTDYQEEVATLNGVNIPFAAYCDELGLAGAPVVNVRPARVWRDRISDTRARLAEPGGATRAPTHARVVDAVWRATDPMPFLVPLARRIRRRLAGLGGRSGERNGGGIPL